MAKKKGFIIGSVGLVLVIVGAISWLLMSGRVTVTFGAAQSVSDNRTIVCGADTVSAYNAAYDAMFHEIITTQLVDDGIASGTPDVTEIVTLADDIKRKDGYGQDPTCQTIIFWSAVYNDDYEGATAAHTAVRELHETHLFANSDIRGNTPLSSWSDEVYALSPEALSEDPGAE